MRGACGSVRWHTAERSCGGKQAKLLDISRGTVYYLPRSTSAADLVLMRQGVQVGRLHVRTLMQRMGICAMTPEPGTSRPAPGHKIYPYLLRQVRVTQANHVWALDTTYIAMERGFVYLTAVVVGSLMATHPDYEKFQLHLTGLLEVLLTGEA